MYDFTNCFHNLFKNYRVFVGAKDQIEMLDDEYISYYPDLYSKSATELVIMLKCGNTFGTKCANPMASTVIVTASRYQV